MLQKIIAVIKRLWISLWRRKETIAPTAHQVETPTPQVAISQPELELGAAVPPEYRQRDSLFTYRERVFFKALIEDVGNQFVVFAK